MSIQKLHYENISGTLVRRAGLLSWRCPLCKAEGQSLEVMRTCPECGSKEAALPGAQPAPIEMSITTGALSEMFLRLDGHDKAQPGYEWRKGWNDAIRQAMDYAQSAPRVPDGWLRAIDEALVTAHIGVANAHDTYEQAKAKLDNLIGFNVDIAIDPAVNGGWKLVPIELTKEMRDAWDSSPICEDDDAEFRRAYSEMLAAAPEVKP